VFGNGFLIPVPSHFHVAIPFPRIIDFHSHSQIKLLLTPKKFPHIIMHNPNVIILISRSQSISQPQACYTRYTIRTRQHQLWTPSTEYAHYAGLGNTVHSLSLATTAQSNQSLHIAVQKQQRMYTLYRLCIWRSASVLYDSSCTILKKAFWEGWSRWNAKNTELLHNVLDTVCDCRTVSCQCSWPLSTYSASSLRTGLVSSSGSHSSSKFSMLLFFSGRCESWQKLLCGTGILPHSIIFPFPPSLM